MPRYEMSLQKTEYLNVTLDAASPEEAAKLYQAEHPQADVEIHSIQEVAAPPQEKEIDCEDCEYNGVEGKFLKCGHPENDGDMGGAFWQGDISDCFTPKIPVVNMDDVRPAGGLCICGRGWLMTDGEIEWCTSCSQVTVVKTDA